MLEPDSPSPSLARGPRRSSNSVSLSPALQAERRRSDSVETQAHPPLEASLPPRGKGEATASAVRLALEVPEFQSQHSRRDYCHFLRRDVVSIIRTHSMAEDYKRNHYVPEWYQKGFICSQSHDRKLCYLDLNPPVYRDGKGVVVREMRPLRRYGPRSCFYQDDLYTTFVGENRSTDVEENFSEKLIGARPQQFHFSMTSSTRTQEYTPHTRIFCYTCARRSCGPQKGWHG